MLGSKTPPPLSDMVFTAEHAHDLLQDLQAWAPKLLAGLDGDEACNVRFKLEGWATRLTAVT